jgi:hypothetical protein
MRLLVNTFGVKEEEIMARSTSKKEIGKVRTMELKVDAEYPTVYSNFMGVGATPFDISIIFAEVSQDGKGLATPRVKIIIAPEQAANLIQMLGDILPKYVAVNGKLRHGGRNIPESALPAKEGEKGRLQ